MVEELFQFFRGNDFLIYGFILYLFNDLNCYFLWFIVHQFEIKGMIIRKDRCFLTQILACKNLCLEQCKKTVYTFEKFQLKVFVKIYPGTYFLSGIFWGWFYIVLEEEWKYYKLGGLNILIPNRGSNLISVLKLNWI